MVEYHVVQRDLLVLRARASVAVVVSALVTVLHRDGSLRDYPRQLLTTNDRAVQDDIGGPGPQDGIVVGVAIAPAAGIKRGEVLAEAYVAPGIGVLARTWLCRGYVYEARVLGLGEFEDPLAGKGRKVDNEGATTLGNNDTVTRTISVPTDARVDLYGGSALNADNVTRTISIEVDDGTNRLAFIGEEGAVPVNERANFPSSIAEKDNWQGGMPFPLLEADRVLIVWAAGGASAGGTARSAAVWEEWIDP